MGEMDEPVQVIRILFEGINIGLKIAGATYREAKAFASVIAACLKHEKTIGKTNMKKLLKKGCDIKLTRIPEDKLKEFEKLCKKYGILYSVMPDLNGHLYNDKTFFLKIDIRGFVLMDQEKLRHIQAEK